MWRKSDWIKFMEFLEISGVEEERKLMKEK